MRRFMAVAVLSVSLIGLSACGSSSKTSASGDGSTTTTAASGSGSTTTTTAAASGGGAGGDFVTKGNAICTKGSAEEVALVQPLSSPPTDAELQAVFPKVLANVKSQIDQIDALDPPAGQKAEVDKFLADAREVISQLQAEGYTSLNAETDPFAAVDAEAGGLGLTACSDT